MGHKRTDRKRVETEEEALIKLRHFAKSLGDEPLTEADRLDTEMLKNYVSDPAAERVFWEKFSQQKKKKAREEKLRRWLTTIIIVILCMIVVIFFNMDIIISKLDDGSLKNLMIKLNSIISLTGGDLVKLIKGG